MFNKKSLHVLKGFTLSFFRSYFFLGAGAPVGLLVVAGLLPAAGAAVPDEGVEVAVCLPPDN